MTLVGIIHEYWTELTVIVFGIALVALTKNKVDRHEERIKKLEDSHDNMGQTINNVLVTLGRIEERLVAIKDMISPK